MALEDKKIEIYKNLLLGISGVTEVKYLKTVESSVTTSWGVNWDHDYIARDILQNFRDANLKEIDKIDIKVHDDQISAEHKELFVVAFYILKVWYKLTNL